MDLIRIFNNRRWLNPVVLVAVLAGLFTGCTTNQMTDNFPIAARIPYNGDPIGPDAWALADSYPTMEDNTPVASKEWGFSWLFPLTVYSKSAHFESDQRLSVKRFVYDGLGFPLVFLPLRYNHNEYLYGPTYAETTGYQKVHWNLFYAHTERENWPEDRGNFYAHGYPILGSYAHYRSEDINMNFWHGLWSLGPAYATFAARLDEDGMKDVRYQKQSPYADFLEVDGLAGMPLALGGGLGAIVWLDTDLNMTSRDSDGELEIHGPLMGMLGYIRTSENRRSSAVFEAADKHDPRRKGFTEKYRGIILGGLLWKDYYTAYDALPESQNSSHGPIWGMFGWGKDNGHDSIRVLWLPIKIN